MPVPAPLNISTAASRRTVLIRRARRNAGSLIGTTDKGSVCNEFAIEIGDSDPFVKLPIDLDLLRQMRHPKPRQLPNSRSISSCE